MTERIRHGSYASEVAGRGVTASQAVREALARSPYYSQVRADMLTEQLAEGGGRAEQGWATYTLEYVPQ